MKTFDPMNSGDDDFESDLRGLKLRQPPAEWRDLLVPPAIPPAATPGLPKPLVAVLAVCWAATACFVLSKPEDERLNLPMLPSSPPPPSMEDPVFTYNETPKP
ncbi:MAG: hypothetical protein JWO82_1632 [Akkermansiaceae bacterium]|nr:hypothetical protein [Akkermansiaceae bacterium]